MYYRHKKIVDETENGIASITFILEQYIKKTIGKVFKDSLTCQGVDVWKDTKKELLNGCIGMRKSVLIRIVYSH